MHALCIICAGCAEGPHCLHCVKHKGNLEAEKWSFWKFLRNFDGKIAIFEEFFTQNVSNNSELFKGNGEWIVTHERGGAWRSCKADNHFHGQQQLWPTGTSSARFFVKLAIFLLAAMCNAMILDFVACLIRFVFMLIFYGFPLSLCLFSIIFLFSPGRQAAAKQTYTWLCLSVCLSVTLCISRFRRSWKLKLWWNVVWVNTILHAKFWKNPSQFWVPNGNPFLLCFSSFRTCFKLKVGSCM